MLAARGFAVAVLEEFFRNFVPAYEVGPAFSLPRGALCWSNAPPIHPCIHIHIPIHYIASHRIAFHCVAFMYAAHGEMRRCGCVHLLIGTSLERHAAYMHTYVLYIHTTSTANNAHVRFCVELSLNFYFWSCLSVHSWPHKALSIATPGNSTGLEPWRQIRKLLDCKKSVHTR